MHLDSILLLVLNAWFFFLVVDTDGFVIPSLGIEESDQCKDNVSSIESTNSAAKVG
jgi:hypothetical protein